jgi:hypothetical protein
MKSLFQKKHLLLCLIIAFALISNTVKAEDEEEDNLEWDYTVHSKLFPGRVFYVNIPKDFHDQQWWRGMIYIHDSGSEDAVEE